MPKTLRQPNNACPRRGLQALASQWLCVLVLWLNIPLTNTDWVVTDIPQRGELEGGVRYFKHGYGCAVHLPTGTVDFDFGAQGEISGFDAWRLAGFAGDRLSAYGFADEDALTECFKAEAAAGALVYSGYILYYVAGDTTDIQ